jgi:hypothetical protein
VHAEADPMVRVNDGVQRSKGGTRAKASIAFWAILCAGLAIRLAGLDCSFWVDEIWTHGLASTGWREAAFSMPYPLIYLLSRAAYLCFGDTEAVLRMPMIIAGVVGLVAVHRLGSRVHYGLGLAAMALLVLAASHVQASQDARYYAFVMLFATLLLLALERGLTGETWRPWAMAAFVVTVSLLTTPIILPFLFATGTGAVICVLCLRNRPGRMASLVRIAAVFGMGVVGYLVLLLVLHGGNVLRSPFFFMGDQSTPGEAYASQRLGLPAYAQFVRQIAFYTLQHQFDIYVLVVLCAFGSVWLFRKNRPVAVLLTCSVVLPPLPLFIVPVGHFYNANYFTYVLPPLTVFAAAGCFALAELGSQLRKGSVSIAVIFFLSGFVPMTYLDLASLRHHFTLRRPAGDWKGVAQRLAFELGSGDIVIHVRDTAGDDRDAWKYLSKACLDFYLKRYCSNGQVLVGDLEAFGAGAAVEAEHIALANPEKTVWIVDAGRLSHGARDIPRLMSIGDYLGNYDGILLYRCPAPGTNLVRGGGFEAQPPKFTVQGDGMVSLIRDDDAFEGTSIRIVRKTKGMTMVALPDVERIEIDKSYTLSLCLKLQHVYTSEKLDVDGVPGMVAINSGDSSRLLATLAGSHEWQKYTIPIDPGDVLSDGSDLVTLGIGFYEGMGTIWIDNVMLSEGPPRSFINLRAGPRQISRRQIVHR